MKYMKKMIKVILINQNIYSIEKNNFQFNSINKLN